MERVDCSAVYIDDRVNSEGWVSRRSSSASAVAFDSPILSDVPQSLRSDVQLLLLVCKKREFGQNTSPVFAFFDIELGRDDSVVARRKANRASWPDFLPPSSASMRRGFTFTSQSEESYGLQLLSGVASDIQLQESPSLVIPIAVLRSTSSSSPSSEHPESARELQHHNHLLPDPEQISKFLDAGAVDVLTTPLEKARVQGLMVQAYRTQKIALRHQARFLGRRKSRKHSWVGVHDEQPYAYLREAMVSKLMKGICNPEDTIEDFQDRELDIRPEREAYVKDRIGCWDFTAHEYTEDELVFGACKMLQHAFRLPELEPWRLSPSELRTFLLACRAAYNSFVLYHNFRHAIDVLQSVFCFLLHIGALPPYAPVLQSGVSKSPIASLLSPFDILTLLISAIGHDVGHPGVNNFFLVKLNAPLAQLYNDNSVLEAFHCAAFSQILRRYWPVAFKDKQLRKLLISSILATDMGVHQKFMERLGSLQEKFYENNRSTIGWKPQDIDMYKTLLCGLLIKCADISNVARPWGVAEQWTKILQEEFANQGEMEKEVGMETALFGGPPELGNVYKLATGQIGFMSIFAIPLFEGVSDILPQLCFTVEQIRSNQSRWHYFADLEKRKQSLHHDGGRLLDDAQSSRSPRSQSPAVSFKTSRSIPAKDVIATPELTGPEVEQNEEEDAAVAEAVTAKEPPSTDDYFGSAASSAGTASPSGYNENTISPVVSPDTPGPSMDITGSPLPPEEPVRKPSDATQEYISSIARASRRGSLSEPLYGSGLQMQPLPGVDRNRSPADPSVLAALIFANASKNDGEAQDPSRAIDGPVDSPSGERPSSSRHGPPQHQRRPHANTNSSGRASGPPNSQRNSCTRTQSVSTYSNNMTPISPATNATSFLTVDSVDDDDDDDKKSAGSLSRSERDPGSSTRPSTSDPSVEPEGKPSTDPSQLSASDSGNKSDFTTTVVGNRPSTSPSQSTPARHEDHHRHHQHQYSRTPPSEGQNQHHRHQGQQHQNNGGEPAPRRLPKKRSRLRLAFWRRRNHHSHQQELSGET